MPQPIHLVCKSDNSVVQLIAELALHRIDVVIADGPSAAAPIRAFSHLLGECGTTFFASAAVAAALSQEDQSAPSRKTLTGRARHTRRLTGAGFPATLNGAPFLLPGPSSAVRGALEQWFAATGIRPRIVGEFDDSALANDFGRNGLGVFVAPTVIEAEIQATYGVDVVGRSGDVRQQFYAISIERKVRHPAVVAIRAAARQEIFAAPALPGGGRRRS